MTASGSGRGVNSTTSEKEGEVTTTESPSAPLPRLNGWRYLRPHQLREALRKASWRTDKLDGHSLETLVRTRTTPSVAALIDDVLGASASDDSKGASDAI